jgi:3-oxoacyl-[acyl-carrier protein] reductase
MNLKGKVALVTGGGTGLGAVIVRHLALEGMAVAVHYGRSEQEAQSVVDAARSLGIRAEARYPFRSSRSSPPPTGTWC